MRNALLFLAACCIVAPLWYVLQHGGGLLWLWIPVFGLSYIITTEATR